MKVKEAIELLKAASLDKELEVLPASQNMSLQKVGVTDIKDEIHSVVIYTE
jgi:hypothetical protein